MKKFLIKLDTDSEWSEYLAYDIKDAIIKFVDDEWFVKGNEETEYSVEVQHDGTIKRATVESSVQFDVFIER